jgi:hypothetical protein
MKLFLLFEKEINEILKVPSYKLQYQLYNEKFDESIGKISTYHSGILKKDRLHSLINSMKSVFLDYDQKEWRSVIYWGNHLCLHKLMTLDYINSETSKFVDNIAKNDSLFHDPYDKSKELDFYNQICLRDNLAKCFKIIN